MSQVTKSLSPSARASRPLPTVPSPTRWIGSLTSSFVAFCRWAVMRTTVPSIVAMSAHLTTVCTPKAAVTAPFGSTTATPSSRSVIAAGPDGMGPKMMSVAVQPTAMAATRLTSTANRPSRGRSRLAVDSRVMVVTRLGPTSAPNEPFHIHGQRTCAGRHRRRECVRASPDVASPAFVPYSSRPAPPKSTRGALLFIVEAPGPLKQAKTRRPARGRVSATSEPAPETSNEADNETDVAATTWAAVFSHLSISGVHEATHVRVWGRTRRRVWLDRVERRVLHLVWGRQVDLSQKSRGLSRRAGKARGSSGHAEARGSRRVLAARLEAER